MRAQPVRSGCPGPNPMQHAGFGCVPGTARGQGSMPWGAEGPSACVHARRAAGKAAAGTGREAPDPHLTHRRGLGDHIALGGGDLGRSGGREGGGVGRRGAVAGPASSGGRQRRQRQRRHPAAGGHCPRRPAQRAGRPPSPCIRAPRSPARACGRHRPPAGLQGANRAPGPPPYASPASPGFSHHAQAPAGGGAGLRRPGGHDRLGLRSQRGGTGLPVSPAGARGPQARRRHPRRRDQQARGWAPTQAGRTARTVCMAASVEGSGKLPSLSRCGAHESRGSRLVCGAHSCGTHVNGLPARHARQSPRPDRAPSCAPSLH